MSAHRSYARPVPSDPPLALQRTPAADDTDQATRQTIQKMCELIRESVSDPEIQKIAAYIKDRFAQGSDDPAMICWAVFWWMKHSIKFRSDEATMFRVGEQNQQDLLISPAVLVRMKDPSEDCDGFSMLAAALLTALDVSVLIATVAADLDDPRRWSHVFLVAIVNGRTLPLDTSHGSAPGWMVPAARINRWQTWKLDGTPADVPIPTNHGLNGYRGVGAVSRSLHRTLLMRAPQRGVRGMGQAGCATATCISTADDGSCLEWDDSSCTGSGSTGGTLSFPGQTPNCTYPQLWNGVSCADPSVGVNTSAIPLNTPITPAQAGLTAAQQAQLIAAVGNSAVSLIRTASGGPYTVAGTNLVYNPATGQLSSVATSTGINLSTLNLSSLTQYIPIVAGVLLVVMVLPALTGRK